MEGTRRPQKRIVGGQRNPGDVAIQSGAFTLGAGAQIGTLAGGVGPHHSEVLCGTEALVGHTSRQDQ